MSEDSFDSEVMQLISDLELVQIGSPEYREWLAILAASEFTNYWFCERWLAARHDKEKERNRLMRELFKRNKPYSRYVHESFSYQSRLCWQDTD